MNCPICNESKTKDVHFGTVTTSDTQAARIEKLETALKTIANATYSDCDGERWMKTIARNALETK